MVSVDFPLFLYLMVFVMLVIIEESDRRSIYSYRMVKQAELVSCMLACSATQAMVLLE